MHVLQLTITEVFEYPKVTDFVEQTDHFVVGQFLNVVDFAKKSDQLN